MQMQMDMERQQQAEPIGDQIAQLEYSQSININTTNDPTLQEKNQETTYQN